MCWECMRCVHRVDVCEPHGVWFSSQTCGTHDGERVQICQTAARAIGCSIRHTCDGAIEELVWIERGCCMQQCSKCSMVELECHAPWNPAVLYGTSIGWHTHACTLLCHTMWSLGKSSPRCCCGHYLAAGLSFQECLCQSTAIPMPPTLLTTQLPPSTLFEDRASPPPMSGCNLTCHPSHDTSQLGHEVLLWYVYRAHSPAWVQCNSWCVCRLWCSCVV